MSTAREARNRLLQTGLLLCESGRFSFRLPLKCLRAHFYFNWYSECRITASKYRAKTPTKTRNHEARRGP
jgi:hypothetical protein